MEDLLLKKRHAKLEED